MLRHLYNIIPYISGQVLLVLIGRKQVSIVNRSSSAVVNKRCGEGVFCTAFKTNTFCILTALLYFSKCKSCLKHFCSKCQSQENENIVKSGTCDQCDMKVLRTLQEICRSNIRHTIKGAIGVAGSSAHMLQSRDIDQNVQHLPLPGPVKNYVCYK